MGTNCVHLFGSPSAFEYDLLSYTFAKVSKKRLIISNITKTNQPKTIKELLLRLFVVKSVIPKYKVIDIKSIKKSTPVYLLLNQKKN